MQALILEKVNDASQDRYPGVCLGCSAGNMKSVAEVSNKKRGWKQ